MRRMTLATSALTLGLFALHAQPAAAQAPQCAAQSTVKTAGGATICGLGDPGKSVFSYLGIRYATADRWAPSTLVAPAGTMTQTQYGAVCPQTGPDKAVMGSEDCLFLNVWAPPGAINGQQSLPVMVFIHGGAFVTGAGSLGLYDGSALAAHGAVVVTLNYRLGALGFLASNLIQPDGQPVTGNLGILDQQNALRWVQQNIAAFGGDPKRVTLFGESAGAMSVGLHTFDAPASQGLFHAAIMESNPAGVVYLPLNSKSETSATTIGNQFMTYLCNQQQGPTAAGWALTPPAQRNGAKPVEAAKMSCKGDWWKSVPADVIVNNQLKFITSDGAQYLIDILRGAGQSLPWQPNVDGKVILGQPFEGFASAMAGPHPETVAFGSNQNEGTLFVENAYLALPSAFTPTIYKVFLDLKFGLNAASKITKIDRYNPAKQSASASASYQNPTSIAFANLMTDYVFACGDMAMGNAAGASTARYQYYFSQLPYFNLYAGVTGCDPGAGNVCHGDEMPYVFSTASFITAQSQGAYKPTPADDEVSKGMNAAWFGLAADPVHPGAAWAAFPGAANWNASTTPAPYDLDHNAHCSALWLKQRPYTGTSQVQ